jgi:hypothetical protein
MRGLRSPRVYAWGEVTSLRLAGEPAADSGRITPYAQTIDLVQSALPGKWTRSREKVARSRWPRMKPFELKSPHLIHLSK